MSYVLLVTRKIRISIYTPKLLQSFLLAPPKTDPQLWETPHIWAEHQTFIGLLWGRAPQVVHSAQARCEVPWGSTEKDCNLKLLAPRNNSYNTPLYNPLCYSLSATCPASQGNNRRDKGRTHATPTIRTPHSLQPWRRNSWNQDPLKASTLNPELRLVPHPISNVPMYHILLLGGRSASKVSILWLNLTSCSSWSCRGMRHGSGLAEVEPSEVLGQKKKGY